jgi:hypothetical protein
MKQPVSTVDPVSTDSRPSRRSTSLDRRPDTRGRTLVVTQRTGIGESPALGVARAFPKNARTRHGLPIHEARRTTRTRKPDRPRCGARCRSRDGAPCAAPPVWDPQRNRPRNGRCRIHGGLSTGPRTAKGRARCSDAGRRGALKRWEASRSENSPRHSTRYQLSRKTTRGSP